MEIFKNVYFSGPDYMEISRQLHLAALSSYKNEIFELNTRLQQVRTSEISATEVNLLFCQKHFYILVSLKTCKKSSIFTYLSMRIIPDCPPFSHLYSLYLRICCMTLVCHFR